MYDFFIEFCGFPEDAAITLEGQEFIACCCVGLVCIGFALLTNMVITIFRGWK